MGFVLRAQGAIELRCGATAGALSGQGATEYLVLLAVVLIIALVGIALLGFFPGTASDAQIAESQIYWKSAQPIAIVETATRYSAQWGSNSAYILVRNVGLYPIRVTGVVGTDGTAARVFWLSTLSYACGPAVVGYNNISDFFYMAPGEEKYFNYPGWQWGMPPCQREIDFGASTSSQQVKANRVCQNSTADPGMVLVNGFGFEYITYIEGQQITKRQVGTKPFVMKCLPAA